MLFRLFVYKFKFGERFRLKSLKVGIESHTNIIIDSSKNSKLVFGDFVYLYRLGNLEVYDGGEIIIGNRVSINRGFSIVCRSSIRIGDDVIIGPNFMAYDHNHNFSLKEIQFKDQGFSNAAIEIGSNVWIGANVFVSSGIKIGSNSVIAAGSVVTKSVLDGALYAGNPAKFIRYIYE